MNEKSNSGRKVLILGLDGGTFDYLGPRIEAGKLPNLARLVQTGSWGPLLSTVPPFTMPAWTSFMTGKNPGKHGIMSFVQTDAGQYQFGDEEGGIMNASRLKGVTLWEIVGQNGGKVGVVNVPMTFPPRPVNGFLISGMLTPSKSSGYTYPSHLADTLDDYVIDLEYMKVDGHTGLTGIPARQTILDDLTHMLQRRGETSLQLMSSHQWDLFVTVFIGTDRLGHFFWDCLQADKSADVACPPEIQAGVESYLALLDQIVGDMLAAAGEDVNVVVVSDHGFGPAPARRFNINNWLQQAGVLALSSQLGGSAGVSQLDLWLKRHSSLKRLLKQVLPSKMQRKMQAQSKANMGQLIDWSATKAYGVPLYANVCGIEINRSGVKPQGIVSDSTDYETLRTQLVDQARGLIDPETGQRIVQEVYLREGLYQGDCVQAFPDIVLVLDPAYLATPSVMRPGVVCPVDRNEHPYLGDHRKEGMFIALGPGVISGPLGQEASILDVAPTVLYMLGMDIPTDMDGKVLASIFEAKHFEATPPSYTTPTDRDTGGTAGGDVFSDEEEDMIRDRLRSLGYL